MKYNAFNNFYSREEGVLKGKYVLNNILRMLQYLEALNVDLDWRCNCVYIYMY